MRVIINDQLRDLYFGSLKRKAGTNWLEIAKTLRVNNRMLRYWRSGELSIPKFLCDRITELYKISPPKDIKLMPSYWHIKDAARKGGYARYAKYGNLGTPEGRRRGGYNSIKSGALFGTRFVFRKKVDLPKRSATLAKLIGILIGDGGISHFQVRVTLGLKTDREYAFFVKSLLDKLFKTNSSVYQYSKRSTIEVVISSRTAVEFLIKQGLPLGNKIRQKIDIPSWIKKRQGWSRRCLRGIFDTDGSVYLDRHRIKDISYKSINVDFASHSPDLLKSICDILHEEGWTPTLTTKGSIRLRRKKEVVNFFGRST